MQQSCYYSNNNLKSKCSQEKLWLALMINWENNVFTWGFWILSWVLYEVEFHDTCHWFKSVLFFDCIAGLFWSRPFEMPQMLHGDRACYPESLLWSCLLSSPKKTCFWVSVQNAYIICVFVKAYGSQSPDSQTEWWVSWWPLNYN